MINIFHLKDFAILHSVPKQLKQRMQDYFHTMWSLNHGIDPVEVSCRLIETWEIGFRCFKGVLTRISHDID